LSNIEIAIAMNMINIKISIIINNPYSKTLDYHIKDMITNKTI